MADARPDQERTVVPVIAVIHEALTIAWGYRWMILALVLFRYGQAEPWPWTAAQIAADVILVALIARVCGAIRVELASRRYTLAQVTR
jgi:hypothetical protein